MIALTRMRRIVEVNLRDRYAIVEPGLVNVHLTNHLKGTGCHYAPDPSSQGACTVGGNFATNSGGPHTLKYGVTVNHVLGAQVVPVGNGFAYRFGGVQLNCHGPGHWGTPRAKARWLARWITGPAGALAARVEARGAPRASRSRSPIRSPLAHRGAMVARSNAR